MIAWRDLPAPWFWSSHFAGKRYGLLFVGYAVSDVPGGSILFLNAPVSLMVSTTV